MTDTLLQKIIERLDALVAINMPNADAIGSEMRGLPGEVYKLCDFENTVEDMVRKLGKSRNQIDVTLSKLRSRGLIKSVQKDNKTCYVRIGGV
jgi:DNA-binding transcriptional ArsR family regulator